MCRPIICYAVSKSVTTSCRHKYKKNDTKQHLKMKLARKYT